MRNHNNGPEIMTFNINFIAPGILCLLLANVVHGFLLPAPLFALYIDGGLRGAHSIIRSSRLRVCEDTGEGGAESKSLSHPIGEERATSRRIVLKQMATAALPPAAATIALSSPSSCAAADDTTTSLAVAAASIISSDTITAASSAIPDETITAPLEFIPALNAYVVHYTLFGERFGAIVDTGSPFLTVPSTCSTWSYKYKWGCYKPDLTADSGLANTVEGFDNNQGLVVWRRAAFAFDTGDEIDNAALLLPSSHHPTQNLTFGVFGPELLDGPGGVFLGLIKETDRWIRPSFLGQTGYDSFCVDLRKDAPPRLVLSKRPMIRNDDYIPLVRDLHRRYGAPVTHYAAKCASFIVNGLPLKLDDRRNVDTYVIFDTGLTGMAVSEELFEGRNLQARKNREKSLWGEVSVAFDTHDGGRMIELNASRPITTPLGQDTPWTRFRGNLIVLGLAFLDGNAMTVDIDGGKLQFTK